MMMMMPSVRFCLAVASVLLVAFTVDGQLTSCPPGVQCESERCFSEISASKFCCTCEAWLPSGRCTEEGWKPQSGTGSCDFALSPELEADEDSCPPGVLCASLKCQDRTNNATCCDCAAWNDDGSCKDDGWIPRVESHSCEFEVSFLTDASPAQEETDNEPVFDSEALAGALDTTGGQEAPAPEDSPSPRTFIDLSTGGDPALAQEPSPTPPDTVTLTIQGRPADTPLPESASSGADAPAISVASPAPELTVLLTPLEEPVTTLPCPTDQECDTVRCGIIEAVNVCCECLIREADGRCTKDGWFSSDTLEEECALSVINNR